MRNRFYFSFKLQVLTGAALLVTLGSNVPAHAKKTVRVGYLANIVMPQPLVGIVNGEFEKLVPGVEFTGQDFPAGPAVLEQLRAGAIDIAYTGPYPPLKAFAKNKDVVLLAGAAKGGTALLVRKDSPIRKLADLKGKVVGVNQIGSTVDAMVRYRLLKAGLNPTTAISNPEKDVRIIEVAPAEQAAVLQGNEVAAVAAPAPWPSVAVNKGSGRVLLDWRNILDNGNYLSAVAFTTKKFADENPELVAQFVAAHKKITNRLNSNREKGNAEVLAAWSKITGKTLEDEVARGAFGTIEFTSKADLKSLRRDLNILIQVGFSKESADLSGFLWKRK